MFETTRLWSESNCLTLRNMSLLHKTILGISLLISTNASMGQLYRTISKMDVKAICNKTGVEEYSSNEVNHRMICKLKDGKVLVWPANGDLALQFDSEQQSWVCRAYGVLDALFYNGIFLSI
jgi:hypothetical protein